MRDELNLEILRKMGFKRMKCAKCGAVFWSVKDREDCGEYPCAPLKIIEKPIFNRKMDVKGMRKFFIDFFVKRNHTPLERYPVVARWRDDVFLVNASIYDFQPHVTSGLVPPPANPLVISQPCIRLVDTDEVGRTTRHLTGFEMMAHHAFNYPDREIYWKEETVEYAINLLQELGVGLEEITLKEKPWFGGGNAGNAFEVIVGGLELATLVFMDMKEDENGDIEIEGKRYSKMDVRVVDTGYGLERFVWASRASEDSPTIYDAIYPELLEKLMNLANLDTEKSKEFASAGKVWDERYQKIYAICDHTRSIAFMLSDGIVPSNAKEGYLARMLIRRVLRFLNSLRLDLSLYEIVEWQIRNFSDVIKNPNMRVIREMLQLEEERFVETLRKGSEMLRRKLKRSGKVSEEMLVEFYDSHGIPPDVVAEIASEMGIEVKIPENFHRLVVARHSKARKEEKEQRYEIPELPETKKLYYEDSYARKFRAKVLYASDNIVVLDRTLFYPEGGGQPGDTGVLRSGNREIRVKDTQIQDGVILHIVEDSSPFEVGTDVEGEIDWDRRYRLMVHHSSTHLLLGALRKVLGEHIWQAGAQKGVYESRFDVTHYKSVGREEIKEIERVAMEKIQQGLPIKVEFLPRNEAEKRYGFRLYEGGVPPGREIRVVSIEDFDAEACAGTHVRNTGEIGILKILSTERIQDGVVRFIFSAGLSALEKIQTMEDDVIEISRMLRVPKSLVRKGVEKFLEEWKFQRKEIEKLSEYKAKYEKLKILSSAREVCGVKIISSVVDDPIKVSEYLEGKYIAVLISPEGKFIVKSSENIDLRKIGDVLKEILGGGYGVSKNTLVGGGKNINMISSAIERSEEIMESMVREWLCRE